MNIKVGVFYKTKDGEKVRIYEVYEGTHQDYPVHGAVQTGGTWVVRSWTASGKLSRRLAGSVEDIVSLWTVKTKIKVYMVEYQGKIIGGPYKDKKYAEVTAKPYEDSNIITLYGEYEACGEENNGESY